MHLSELCAFLKERDVRVDACPEVDRVISHVAPLASADAEAVSFLANDKYLTQLKATRAGAVLVKSVHAEDVPSGTAAIVVDDPYYAYALVAEKLSPPAPVQAGIHPTAQVDPSATLGEAVSIGPYVVVGPNARIGDHVIIEAHCVIDQGVVLQEGVRLEPHVVIHHDCEVGANTRIKSGAVIGGDGFGFAPHKGRWQPVPQLGRVVIGARCSIGSQVTIDRGALDDTVVGDDVIIDNQVHLAHNVKVGDGTAIVAQVGVSGSTEIGRHCILAGQVGTAGHLRITDGVQIMARGGVTTDVTEPGSYAGFPLQPQKEWQKTMVYTRSLPKLHQELKALKKRLAQLESQLNSSE
ncbi:UDP-3-O-[3-hydroxymyristoyl] glucosamine N-acyltransferase [Sulfurivirga caldicuralii]|uniref:UDP-3-O-acylglucosamine N-acyltransferase n=1 Tax=Sulfurivirga caldicuralii TaxID=364032 RepID=A0A1N6E0Q8_9GAMM|nr:UDP-3-O-(3-hydroxymyristoyl)glucosamine N-acyltransferase [Sulfurivirga caldicuralii]SIN76571.1 UDP-3-O-[3-hydroxymyristoyl] glucosamine N-acyltransferase [Sulfurivirga caldicuralii]